MIFSLLHRIFLGESVDDLKAKALAANISEDDFQAFLVYCCGFFSNSGNYKGFGDSKIVPNLDVDAFEKIVKETKAFKENQKIMESLWNHCKGPIFLLTPKTESLGFPENGVTTYFSDNLTKSDSDLVTEYLKVKKLPGYICRTFKNVDGDRVTFDIKLASIEKGEKDGITMKPEEYKGCTFKVTRGDYSKLLALVTKNLEDAKRYAANENQSEMIGHYIRSFTEGSLDEHKDGSRYVTRK